MPQESPQSNVRVVVRVRPENALELQHQSSNPSVRVLDEFCLIFDPNDEDDSFIRDDANKPGRGPKKKHRDMRFAFDRVFDGTCSQEEVYLGTTRGLVERMMNGINCSVFAYGATGAGKTYTMLGSAEQPGVAFRTVTELFDVIDSKQEEMSCDVKVSYLEVYNETIHDLLKPAGALAVREDPGKGVCVRGLSFYKPESAAELLEMLRSGNENRTQHPTDANAQSSRSHAVFQVYIRQKPRTVGLSAQVIVSKMSLIDLAGSERATMTTNRGMRLREGANINRSLLALGNCINALADQKSGSKRSTHIPYRDSKLTRLLKDSLGGNCCTVMVANVSPSRVSYEDTYNTLKYAERAKSIKSKLTANTVNVDFHVSKYRSIIESLQSENKELKLRLQQQLLSLPPSVPVTSDITGDSVIGRSLLERTESELSPFTSLTSVCLDLTDIEAAERDAMAKGLRKERNIQRMTALGKNDAQHVTKWQFALSAVRDRQSALVDRRKQLLQQKHMAEEQLKQNVAALGLSSFCLDNACLSECDTVGKMMARNRQLEMEKAVLTRQMKHYRQFSKAQNKASQNTERLIHHFCNYIAQVSDHFTSVAGILPKSLQSELEGLLHLIEGCGKELAWADQADSSDTVTIPGRTRDSQSTEKSVPVTVPTPAIATTSGILTPSVTEWHDNVSNGIEDQGKSSHMQSSESMALCQDEVGVYSSSSASDNNRMCVALPAPFIHNGHTPHVHATPATAGSARKHTVSETKAVHDGNVLGSDKRQLLLRSSSVSHPAPVGLLPPPPRPRTPRRARRRVTYSVDNPISLSNNLQQHPANQGVSKDWAMSTDPEVLEALFQPLVCPATPKMTSRSTTPIRQAVTRSSANQNSGLLGSKSPFSVREDDKSRLPQRIVRKRKMMQRGEADVKNGKENQAAAGRSRVVGVSKMKRPHDGYGQSPAKRANIAGSSLARKRGFQAGSRVQPSTPGKREWHVWGCK